MSGATRPREPRWAAIGSPLCNGYARAELDEPIGDASLIEIPSRQPAEAAASLSVIPGNPAPAGGLVRRIRASDGIVLRAARWTATRALSQGTVAIFPGHAEFIEKYFEVVTELRARGFAVAALDWRGQGGSARELVHSRKGHIDDFSLYHRDIAAFLDEIVEPYCPKPWFALAHSMGAAILLSAAHDRTLPFERAALVAPMFRIALGRAEPVARALAQALDILGLGGAFIPGGGERPMSLLPFEDNPLSSDPRRFARTADIVTAAPHLAIGSPTIGWINAAFRFCANFAGADYARDTMLPCLVFSCGADRIVENAAIDRFVSRLKVGWHLPVPHARHELLMEQDAFRSQFWAAFDAFIPGTRSELHTLGRLARS